MALLGIESYRLLRLITISTAFFGLKDFMRKGHLKKAYCQWVYSGLFFSLLVMVFVITGYTEEEVIVIDDFERGLSPKWETKDFKEKTMYTVIETDGTHVLKAESKDSATGLIYRYKYNPKEYPILTWRWKIDNIIHRGDATKKKGDDYAARIYVVFTHWFPHFKKTINYIWANKFPKGNHIKSTYYSRDFMVAVESGEDNVDKWVTERRNVYEDYRFLFGGEPPDVDGIAIMTDTDDTGGSATAYYDDIRIEKP